MHSSSNLSSCPNPTPCCTYLETTSIASRLSISTDANNLNSNFLNGTTCGVNYATETHYKPFNSSIGVDQRSKNTLLYNAQGYTAFPVSGADENLRQNARNFTSSKENGHHTGIVEIPNSLCRNAEPVDRQKNKQISRLPSLGEISTTHSPIENTCQMDAQIQKTTFCKLEQQWNQHYPNALHSSYCLNHNADATACINSGTFHEGARSTGKLSR